MTQESSIEPITISVCQLSNFEVLLYYIKPFPYDFIFCHRL